MRSGRHGDNSRDVHRCSQTRAAQAGRIGRFRRPPARANGVAGQRRPAETGAVSGPRVSGGRGTLATSSTSKISWVSEDGWDRGPLAN